MKYLLSGILILFIMHAEAQSNVWDAFAKTKFVSKYNESSQEYLFYPEFSPALKGLEKKEVELRGYFVPFAPEGEPYIILSKFPMSQCFFCGGGGPESIAEIHFRGDPGRFKVDDIITVKGKLELNVADYDHLNFILKDTIVIKRE